MTTTFAPDVRRALPVLLAQRLILNTGGRMVFTYLPILSTGTGLSIAALSRVIFARDLSGLLGPWVGGVVRRRGAWTTMMAAGLLAALGMALVLLGPVGVVVGLVLWGLCRTSFLVAANSWIGDVVAYERRGRASGLIELTWAAAALIGLPILGLAIGRYGWWAAPLLLSALGGPVALWARSTAVPEGGQAGRGDRPGASGGRFDLGSMSVERATMVALGAIASMFAAAQFLLFTHGLWLADTYDFDATQVGFAIVSSIPLVSELEADNRSAVIGLGTGMATVARATVSLVAAWIYVAHGFQAMMILASLMLAVSIVVLLVAVREPGAERAG